MKNLINLTKIYFKETITSFMGKTKKSQAKSMSLFFVLFAIIGLALGYNYYIIAESLSPVGLAYAVLPLGLITGCVIFIVTNTKGVGSVFYKAKDYEMLASFPINNSTIITAKYLSFILTSVVFGIATIVPVYVVYFIFCEINILLVLMCTISLLFLPTFSQLLGCLIAWISSLILSKIKNKNLMIGIVSLVLSIALIAVLSMLSSDIMLDMFSNDFPLWIKIVMPFIYFLDMAILKNSILYFLAFVGVCLFYGLISVGLIVIGYKKINSNLSVAKTQPKQKEIKFEEKSVFVGILKKDAKKFFTTPAYFVNVIVGPLLSLVLPFAMWGMTKDLEEAIDVGINFVVLLSVFTVPMVVNMSPVSASAISIEGASFKLIKSLPISHKEYLWSKIIFNILLNLPFLLISEILTVILLKLNILTGLLFVLMGFAYLYFSSLFSLFINLLFPKLDWTSVSHVVKQSKSVFFSMLFNMIITIVPMVIGIALISPNFNINLFLICVLVGIMLFNILITVIFIKIYEKLYNKLS